MCAVETVRIDQPKKSDDGASERVGEWRFDACDAIVVITNEGTDEYVIVDAVQMVKIVR